MAYQRYDNSSDEGKVSDWNAAALKMKRLDRELTTLNEINGNLWIFNEMYGAYHYELKLKTLDNLYLEVENKCKEKEEKEVAVKLRDKIIILMERYRIHEVVRNDSLRKSASKKNKIIFKVLENLLFEYERFVKKLLDNHGLDTAYDNESSLF